MDAVLVDTNVVSYLLKGDTRGDRYASHLDGRLLHISFVTVAELYRWAVHYNWGKTRLNTLREKLGNYDVLPSDDQTCWEWANFARLRVPAKDPDLRRVYAQRTRDEFNDGLIGLPLFGRRSNLHFDAVPIASDHSISLSAGHNLDGKGCHVPTGYPSDEPVSPSA